MNRFMQRDLTFLALYNVDINYVIYIEIRSRVEAFMAGRTASLFLQLSDWGNWTKLL
jgi:hypothetical protein